MTSLEERMDIYKTVTVQLKLDMRMNFENQEGMHTPGLLSSYCRLAHAAAARHAF
jgi:hypothetical protein